jgi:Tfp pilus assembly protein PilF
LQEKGQRTQAIASYRQAIRLAPENAVAHFNLGSALRRHGKVEEAIACYHKAIALNPRSVDPLVNLGGVLCDVKGDYAGAITCFQKALSLDPRSTKAHNNLGIALTKQGKVDEALASFRRAIAIDPKFARAHTELGVILCNIKQDYEGAIAAFHQAIRFAPASAWAWTCLGIALRKQGKLDEAIPAFRRAILVDSKYALAHSCLGFTLKDRGKLDGAISAFRQALALDPKNTEIRTTLQFTERLAALEPKLPAILQGGLRAISNDDRLALVALCKTRQLHATRAALFLAAFQTDSRLAEDLQAGHRYDATCGAALAGCGQGTDSAALSDTQRLRWRRQALTWLRADLALWTKRLHASKPADGAAVQATLRRWQHDTDLASLRDDAALAKLPTEEREACRRLWADVAALIEKARPPSAP